VFEFPNLNKKYNTLDPKPSRLYRNPVAVAQEWQRALAKGECCSRADLARKLGISRARVTQMLRLLRLAPEVLETIAGLGDPLPSPIITERRLRPVVSLPPEAQKCWIDNMLEEKSPPSVEPCPSHVESTASADPPTMSDESALKGEAPGGQGVSGRLAEP